MLEYTVHQLGFRGGSLNNLFTTPIEFNGTSLNEFLNWMASEGWEVVGFTEYRYAMYGYLELTYTFKRWVEK